LLNNLIISKSIHHRFLFSSIFIFLISSALIAAEVTDIKPDHPQSTMINFIISNKLIPKYANKTYREKNALNKAQFITGLVKLKKTPIVVNEEPIFSDLKSTDGATKYIEAAYDNKILEKKGDNFDPESVLSAVDAVAIAKKFFPDITLEKKEGSLTRGLFAEMLGSSKEVSGFLGSFEKEAKFDKFVGDKMMDDAINQYLEGNPDALDKVDYLMSKDNKGEHVDDLVDIINNDNALKNAEDKRETEALNFIDRKLNEALVFFYEWKFWKVIQLCNTVIEVDPWNIKALSRKGSAYYMLGKMDLAKKYWEIALEVEPNNKTLQAFVSSL
jgi:tetratricopeptide (TPR) repeat protein